MKAIVLTCDRYRVITEHMILQYARHWPEHPFVFHVPYQEEAARGEDGPRRRYRRTPRAIKATVLALLDGLPDREWVYWCIDDKFPVRLETGAIASMTAELDADPADDMDGLLFCRCRETLHDPAAALLPHARTDAAGRVFLERRSWHQIWLHQFLRVKVLRGLFEGMPDDIGVAKEMDALKFAVPKPPGQRLYVTEQNYAVFGESTKAGRIMQGCHESVLASGLTLPAHFAEHNGRRSMMGRL